jgi:hypothetical protein
MTPPAASASSGAAPWALTTGTPPPRWPAASPRPSSSGSGWCWRSLSRPLRHSRAAQHSECSSGHGPRFWANLCNGAQIRAGVEDALCLVELRGFEPLTPCMPLTSQPLAPHHASTRCLISVLLSTQIAMKRHGAGCGDVRLRCWQIAGSAGHRRRWRHRARSTDEYAAGPQLVPPLHHPKTSRHPAQRRSAPGLGPAAPPIVLCCHRRHGGWKVVSYSAWAVVGSLGRTRSSWPRELIASLVKTLPR